MKILVAILCLALLSGCRSRKDDWMKDVLAKRRAIAVSKGYSVSNSNSDVPK